MVEPVMYDAISDAKKTTEFAMSSGVAALFRGMVLVHAFNCSSFNAAVMSVATKPGATQFTVIPREPTSFASDLLKPIKPAFAAA